MEATAGHWIRDVKENETFFLGGGGGGGGWGWGVLLKFIYIWLYHIVLHSSSFFFL